MVGFLYLLNQPAEDGLQSQMSVNALHKIKGKLQEDSRKYQDLRTVINW